MPSLELSDPDSDITIEVPLDVLMSRISEQYIIGDNPDREGFMYLSALAMETYSDDGYTIVDTLMEFIENEFELEEEEFEEIEEMLR